MKLSELKKYSIPLLRYSMALVFFYFAIVQLIEPSVWAGYLPDFLYSMPNPEIFIYMNAIFEIIFGIFLALGVWTRVASLLLGLHLLGITLSIGLTPVGARDFGLAIATLVIFLHGPDELCPIRDKI
jgi:uncharacterized membrane protein YphA (DoxX/SURF4 family)